VQVFRAETPAKINLFLDVLGRRDDGYHEIATFFYPLPAPTDTIEVEVVDRAGVTVVCDHPAVPDDAENICIRAARAYAAAAGVPASWRIAIEKRIPVAAGLGGGSSDAGAVLRLLNRACGGVLNPQELLRVAATVGADVPFFLGPSVPALGTGTGTTLAPVPFRRDLCLVLLAPEFPVSAAWAYANLDRAPRPAARVSAAKFVETFSGGTLQALAAQMYNALEFAVGDKFPLVGLLREFLDGEGALATHVSGSGPTVFGIFAEPPAPGLAERVGAVFGSELTVLGEGGGRR